ncbi:hypothetical protein ACJ41O_014406 [Fusarium nematophilum]
MHLLNIKTLKLEYFISNVPPYAILSHIWGPREVTHQDVKLDRDLDQKPGWIKIVDFCHAVTATMPEPPEYVWVDTCCLDRTSSAEISEYVNAMFSWYRQATCCFAYLEDVVLNGSWPVGDAKSLAGSPADGHSLSSSHRPRWTFLTETGASWGPKKMLQTGNLSRASVADKMSWAAGRQTEKPEDIAYCLVGIFDISMSVLYSERDKAFIRLQEELSKEYDDHTIFAWDSSSIPSSVSTIGALAPHPDFFSNSLNLEPLLNTGDSVSSIGRIRLGLPVMEQPGQPGQPLGVLSCFAGGDFASAVGIPLARQSPGPQHYSRTRSPPIYLAVRPPNLEPTTVLLTKRAG